MIRNVKLKGGALMLVIGICTVISVILSSTLLVVYYHKMLFIQYDLDVELSRNIGSAVSFIHATPDDSFTNGNRAIDLYGTGSDSVSIGSSPWGVYQKMIITATHGKFNQSKAGLFGSTPNTYQDHALYLSDHGRTYLTVGGNGQIIGDILVPSGRIQRGRLGTQNASTGSSLVGNIGASTQQLPTLDLERVEYLNHLLSGNFEEHEVLNTLKNQVNHTFLSPTMIYRDDLAIHLRQVIKNNVVIYSSEKITVSFSSKLDGVLLVAPKIIIEEYTDGSFQAIASDSIIVRPGATLRYPSALALISTNSSGLISIDGSVEGSVFAYGSSEANLPVVQINRYSMMMGEVISNGYVEHYGRLNGTIICDYLLLNQFGEIRENNLYNGVIDRQQLPGHFVFSTVLDEKNAAIPLKWYD